MPLARLGAPAEDLARPRVVLTGHRFVGVDIGLGIGLEESREKVSQRIR
jgi:hypothetical protein